MHGRIGRFWVRWAREEAGKIRPGCLVACSLRAREPGSRLMCLKSGTYEQVLWDSSHKGNGKTRRMDGGEYRVFKSRTSGPRCCDREGMAPSSASTGPSSALLALTRSRSASGRSDFDLPPCKAQVARHSLELA